MARRGAATSKPKTRRNRAEDAADVQAAAEARASIAGGEPVVPWEQVKEQAEHPGVLVVGGQPAGDTCEHPKGRRDGKNPRLCRACGESVPDGMK